MLDNKKKRSEKTPRIVYIAGFFIVLSLFTLGVAVFLIVNEVQQDVVLQVEVDANAARYESLRLAGDSIRTVDENAEVAALLGIRALQTAYTDEASTSLIRALDEWRGIRTFGAHEGGDVAVYDHYMLAGTYQLQLWNLDTGELVNTFIGHRDRVTSVAFSPNGKQAVTGSWDNTVIIWDIATGTPLITLEGHSDWVLGVDYSPDGRYVASGAQDATAIVWDALTGEIVRKFEGFETWVRSILFAPASDFLFVAGGTNVTLWHIATGDLLRTYDQIGNVYKLVMWPTQMSILAASDHYMVQYDISTGKRIHVFEGHKDSVHDVAFAPDGLQMVSVSWDRTVIVWDTIRQEQIETLTGHTMEVLGVAFLSDGKRVVSSGGENRLIEWNLETPDRIYVDTALVINLAWLPNGTGAVSTATWDSSLRLWSLTSPHDIGRFEGHEAQSFGLSVAPDGKHAVSGGEDTDVIIWKLPSSEIERRLLGHERGVAAVAYSPDGTKILSGSGDMNIILWDAATGERLQTFPYSEAVNGLAFLPDGKQFISSSTDKTLTLWDIETETQIRNFSGHSNLIFSIAVSPDGRFAASGSYDRTVILWDVATGQRVRTFEGHQDFALRVAFSPDGTLLASSSADKTIILWEVSTGRLVRTLKGHTDWVPALAFSPNGTQLLSGSADGTLRLWDVDYTDLLTYACTRVTRDLSASERAMFELDDSPTCPQFMTNTN